MYEPLGTDANVYVKICHIGRGWIRYFIHTFKEVLNTFNMEFMLSALGLTFNTGEEFSECFRS